MAITSHPGKSPLHAPAPATWGDLGSPDEPSRTVRFVLPGRVVSVPFTQFRSWELVAGEPETLTLTADRLTIVIEGRRLAPVGLALDLQLLSEVRPNREFQSDRAATHVREISIEFT